MRLVYNFGGAEVQIGDKCVLRDNEEVEVVGIQEPHKPESTGRVHVIPAGTDADDGMPMSYFPSVIGAKWIEREDR